MDYSVKIESTSKELTKKERIAIKDTSAMNSIDSISQIDENLIIDVDYYATLSIHNDKAKDNTDYKNLVIHGKNGEFYYTGSQAFTKAFESISEEMEDEDFSIRVYRKPSKNYANKEFISCTIV